MLRGSVKDVFRRLLRPPLHNKEVALDYVVLGTEYGGWPLLQNTRTGSLIFSFGLGEDISFDLAAIAKFNCRVIGFDPTPKSVKWVQSQALPNGFTFYQIGIADFDGTAEFSAPANNNYVSFSIARPDNSLVVRAEVLRIDTIISRMNTGVPDIMKMDVEGFEYGVIKDIVTGSARPGQLLVEFHHGIYGISVDQTKEAVSHLKSAGYRLFYVSSTGHEYGFVHDKIEATADS
jgi:FkbM family methyltransferase